MLHCLLSSSPTNSRASLVMTKESVDVTNHGRPGAARCRSTRQGASRLHAHLRARGVRPVLRDPHPDPRRTVGQAAGTRQSRPGPRPARYRDRRRLTVRAGVPADRRPTVGCHDVTVRHAPPVDHHRRRRNLPLVPARRHRPEHVGAAHRLVRRSAVQQLRAGSRVRNPGRPGSRAPPRLRLGPRRSSHACRHPRRRHLAECIPQRLPPRRHPRGGRPRARSHLRVRVEGQGPHRASPGAHGRREPAQDVLVQPEEAPRPRLGLAHQGHDHVRLRQRRGLPHAVPRHRLRHVDHRAARRST